MVVLTSQGPAVEWWGCELGEFEEVAGRLEDGVAYYRQRHSVAGEPEFLYR